MTIETWIADFNKCLDAWDGKYIITSPDIDGILSACLLADKFGAKLAGVYTTRYLILFDGCGAREAKSALWLDHDVSEEGIQCMGQHLVDHSELDKLPKRGKNSFNPNNYFRQTWKKSFKGAKMKDGQRDKYPYATIHFLMAGMGVPSPSRNSIHFHLLAHADGSWGTCVDYNLNTMTWKNTMFGETQEVVNVLNDGYVNDRENFLGHSKVIQDLLSLGVEKRSSRSNDSSLIPKEWRILQGNQSIPYKKNKSPQEWLTKFNRVLEYVSRNTNWNIQSPKVVSEMHRGLVLAVTNRGEIEDGDFDQFMFDEEIFSHAITSSGTMRFTKHISIDTQIKSKRKLNIKRSLYDYDN